MALFGPEEDRPVGVNELVHGERLVGPEEGVDFGEADGKLIRVRLHAKGAGILLGAAEFELTHMVVFLTWLTGANFLGEEAVVNRVSQDFHLLFAMLPGHLEADRGRHVA